MKRVMIVRIILIILIITMLLISIFVIKAKANTQSDNSSSTISQLKASQYTNDNFNNVELGMKRNEVSKVMGELSSVSVDSKYDVYEYEDGDILYYFYFKHDHLKNVTVYTS